MAILPFPQQVLDGNGDPVVGATLTIYLPNTTTPVDIFRDAALSVAATNPTSHASDISDAEGRFPLFHAADGTLCDMTLKTSGGVTIDSWKDLPFVGEGSSDITRILSNLGRFSVTDSGGVVTMAIGDPDPDNTGGTFKIQGWAGTQADLVTVDSALVAITGTTAAALKVNNRKIPGSVQTEATSFSAVTEVLIPLTNAPSGVVGWKVRAWFNGTVGLQSQRVQFSYDGGATYKSGASDYSYAHLYTDNTGTAAQVLSAALNYVQLAINLLNTANRPMYLEMTVVTPTSGSDDTMMQYDMMGFDTTTGNVPRVIRGCGYGRGAYGRATNLRLFPNSGTITGKYMVEAIYGMGET